MENPKKNDDPFAAFKAAQRETWAKFAPLEAGTHLFVSASEVYVPVIVSSPERGGGGGLPPVLRIYSEPGATLDVRTRLLARAKLGNAELRAFVLSALPPPGELFF